MKRYRFHRGSSRRVSGRARLVRRAIRSRACFRRVRRTRSSKDSPHAAGGASCTARSARGNPPPRASSISIHDRLPRPCGRDPHRCHCSRPALTRLLGKSPQTVSQVASKAESARIRQRKRGRHVHRITWQRVQCSCGGGSIRTHQRLRSGSSSECAGARARLCRTTCTPWRCKPAGASQLASQ